MISNFVQLLFSVGHFLFDLTEVILLVSMD